jgi:chemotaxis protein methyltransferase WspC
MMSAELRGIEELLAHRIGLDPASVGCPLLLRAARKRMNELGLADLGIYESRVRQSASELQALIEEVVVAESWFFRDERPFQWFREYVRSLWLADRERPPLTVLSVPCAGGEEPYSIAMTLVDLGLPVHRFQIDAVDVSEHRLAIARRGVYSCNAFRGPDLAYRARYFREGHAGYELDPSIRASVRFFQASVLDPGLLAGSPPFDVVFCRNLLIYLGKRARVSVLAAIDRLLASDGVLFVGHADTIERTSAGLKFVGVDNPGCFAYRRMTAWDVCLAERQLPPPLPNSGASALGDVTTIPYTAKPPVVVAPQAQATAVAESGISSAPVKKPSALLDQAAELANQGRFGDALKACERHLHLQSLSPAAYYLMGIIYQATGDCNRAEDCFHKTVYLDPRHDEALLALALFAERRGDNNAAVSFRRRAERSANLSTERVS